MNDLIDPRFPRSNKYHPDWVLENCFGANPLWLAEWLTNDMALEPGMRVLDLGCGRAKSSIFLAKEFGVQVWATDLWISAAENTKRIQDAELEDQVFPIHADARALPFAPEFFDAIVSVDSFSYYGTDRLFLNYLMQFLKEGGQIGVAGAGVMKEFGREVPKHLKRFWTQDAWCLHTSPWWREHWERTGLIDLEIADDMPEGCEVWLNWAHATDCSEWYLETLTSDSGQYLGYIRLVGRRNGDAKLADYCWPDTLRSWPIEYERQRVLRD